MENEYKKAGKISADALNFACKMTKVGASVYEIAEKTEGFIIKQNAGIAFPLNISINNQAAHYSPSKGDELVLTEKDVVKVDIGAHVNGFIGDNARTIDLTEENGKLVEASKAALENALSVAKAGINTILMSKEIQNTIKSYGFKPIRNLSGHQLGQYELHAGGSVANAYPTQGFVLEEGMAVAVEPFASTGNGEVSDDVRTEIFSVERVPLTRSPRAREIFNYAKENFNTLPFAERWIMKKFTDDFSTRLALRELVKTGGFRAYPILKDVKGSLVSQAEHTILITEDSCEITTAI